MNCMYCGTKLDDNAMVCPLCKSPTGYIPPADPAAPEPAAAVQPSAPQPTVKPQPMPGPQPTVKPQPMPGPQPTAMPAYAQAPAQPQKKSSGSGLAIALVFLIIGAILGVGGFWIYRFLSGSETSSSRGRMEAEKEEAAEEAVATEAAKASTEEPAEAEPTADADQGNTPTGAAPTPEEPETAQITDSGKVLNIYCWNTEFPGIMARNYPGYIRIDDEHGQIGDVKVNFIIVPDDENQYLDRLDSVLAKQDSAAADDKVDIFLVESEYALDYVDSARSMPVTDLGIQSSELSEQYPYTKVIVTDRVGNLKGVTWQACPSVMIYNRAIAKDVLGSDDPQTVQAAVNTWDQYYKTAAAMGAEGYWMTATAQDPFRAYVENTKQPWVTNFKISVDANAEAWAVAAREMVNAGYTKNGTIWSDEWNAGFYPSGNVFCYFGPPWLYRYCMQDSDSTSVAAQGGWAVTEGPQSFHWGGSWLLAATGTDNPQLVADIFRKMTMDAEVMTAIAEDTGDFVNNRSVIAAIAQDPDFCDDILGGQNAYGILSAVADRIDASHITIYDADCNNAFMESMSNYIGGKKSYEEARADFYGWIETLYPDLSH